MDQESLAQIQEIVGTATESLRADIADARRHSTDLTEGLRQELHVVTGSLRTDIADARQHSEVLSNGLRQELRADIAEARRHSGILNEELRHELQLVAEGFQMHVSQSHAAERAHLDEQFRETRALVQLSYGQIQERVERL